jgi:hypothetical protein
VGAITEGHGLAVFAATEIDGLVVFGHIGNWIEACACMCAVTKWLFLATATAAPVIGFATLHCYCVGTYLGNDCFAHGELLFVRSTLSVAGWQTEGNAKPARQQRGDPASIALNAENRWRVF